MMSTNTGPWLGYRRQESTFKRVVRRVIAAATQVVNA